MLKIFGPHNRIWILIILSAAIRLLLAAFTELGNDEVYYVNYALYPDLSHFDHPPMIGWLIQLFSLNLYFSSELFIRLGAVVAGSISTWLIYRIGIQLYDEVTGWYAALLFTASFYAAIIAGTFIMPDAPQVLFWLLTLWFLIQAFEPAENQKSGGNYWLLAAGAAAGLALLSKYTSIFLFTGAFIYLLLYDRPRLLKWQVYAAVAIALLLFLPVLIWNARYNFVSFTFHSERVEVASHLIRPDLFLTEAGGQIFYNNPIVFSLIWLAVIAVIRGKLTSSKPQLRLLLAIALPVIALFLGFSLFRRTLPHWTGPAYITLIPVAALYLRTQTKQYRFSGLMHPAITAAMIFAVIVLALASLQLSHGIILNKGIDKTTGKRLGIKDITLDMYGWEQLKRGFAPLYRHDTITGRMRKNAAIISQRWFPGANLDYYVARPLGIRLLTLAPLERTHKYAWITQYRGGFNIGMDAYFFSSSYDYADPGELYKSYFLNIEKPDTIPVYRNQVLVEYFYMWRMRYMLKLPADSLSGRAVADEPYN